MNLTLFDHVLVFILAAWMPVQGALFYRRLQQAIASGAPDVRMRAYGRTMLWEWSLAGAVIIGWAAAGRSFGDLGLHLSLGWGSMLGMGLSLAACGFLLRQMSVIATDPDAQAQLRETMHHLRAVVPSNRREMRRFMALSFTAGICEELLYRGFLLWYLGQITSAWLAVLVACLIFGVGHVYQGGKGVLKTGLFGLVATALYLLTSALWAPMLLHAVLDMTSGNILSRVLHPRGGDSDTTAHDE